MKINKKKYLILLAKKCMTVTELARLSGVSTVTLGKLRNGSVGKPETIGKIAKALEVDVTDLIED
jgi:DNA-binding Xre family transcriptional regulator